MQQKFFSFFEASKGQNKRNLGNFLTSEIIKRGQRDIFVAGWLGRGCWWCAL
jgi:hypothetical protein